MATNKTLTYRYVVFGFVTLAFFFVFFHRTSTAVMAPELAAEFAIDPVAIGLLGSMYFYAYAAAQIPAGILADNWGIRKTMSTFLLFAGAATLLFAVASNFNLVLISRFMVGLGVAFIYVPAMRVLTDWFRRNEFATYNGILVAVGNLGALAAAAPLVFLMASLGWRNAMAAIGIVTLVIAVLIYIFVRNKPADIGGASMAEIEGIPPVPTTTIGIGEALKIIIRNYNFWTLVALFLVWLGTIFSFQGLWSGPYLMNVYQLTEVETGSIIMLIAIGALIGCPVAGIVADKLVKSKKKMVLIAVCCYTLIWIPLVFMTGSMSLTFIRILMFLFGFFAYWNIVVWANLKVNFDSRIMGTASGFLNLFGFLGAAVYQQLMGYIISKAPVTNNIIATSGFKSAFLFCLISLVIVITFFTTQKE
ncbi:MAG: MFS transporter [Syntrophomonadaceae bacterium]